MKKIIILACMVLVSLGSYAQFEQRSHKPKSTTNSSSQRHTTSSNNTTRRSSSGKSTTKQHSSSTKLEATNCNSVSLSFGSDFTKLVGATYGIQGQFFMSNNFGATVNVGGNWGLSDNTAFVVKIGPSYLLPINEHLYVVGSVGYSLTSAKYNGNSGTISGAYFMPTFGVAFNHFRIAANGELGWRNGGKLSPGTYITVGYAF